MRVLPQQNFLIRLDCPPGQACAYNSPPTNQIKLLRRFWYRKETPSWDPEHACKVPRLAFSFCLERKTV